MSGEPMPRPVFPKPRNPRSADSPEPIPAAGVMLHLLGAVALGWTVIIWAALAALGVITASVFGVAVASIALTCAAAWAVWLVRATAGRGDNGDREPGDAAGVLGDGGAVDPEEHFHSN